MISRRIILTAPDGQDAWRIYLCFFLFLHLFLPFCLSCSGFYLFPYYCIPAKPNRSRELH
ncbi:hypothetical protein BJX99DRAFT_223642 [Aspergillus californicus]